MLMRSLFMAVALSAVVATNAVAVTIGFAPTSQSVALGDPVVVDVLVSGLEGEIVSAYDLDILYDPGVLDAIQVSFGSDLGDVLEVLEEFDLGTPGLVDLAQVSLLGDAELLALQGGDEVILATLAFETVALGTTALTFFFDAANDLKGANALVLAVSGEDGSVQVVPEPGTAVLLGIGLVLMRRRRRRARPRPAPDVAQA